MVQLYGFRISPQDLGSDRTASFGKQAVDFGPLPFLTYSLSSDNLKQAPQRVGNNETWHKIYTDDSNSGGRSSWLIWVPHYRDPERYLVLQNEA